MKNNLTTAIIFALLMAMGACRSVRVAPSSPVILNNLDSVHTEYIETVRLDTILVEVPIPDEHVNQTVGDGKSHLETGLAESYAWINADGTLGHTLANKPGARLEAKTIVPIKETQSNRTNERIREVSVPYPEYVEVERNFSMLEKIKLKSFWLLIAVCCAGTAWIFLPRKLLGR